MSFLDNVQLAFQCPLRWEKLVGGERERYCSTCEKHVHNISAMSRGEAKRFLAAQNAPICIRVEVDAQGRAVHRPGLGALALAASLAACGNEGDSAFDSGGTAMVDGITVGQGSEAGSAGLPGLAGLVESGAQNSAGTHTIAEVGTVATVGQVALPAQPKDQHPVSIGRIPAYNTMMGGMRAPQAPVTINPDRVLMGEPVAPPVVVPPVGTIMGKPPPPTRETPVLVPEEKMGKVAAPEERMGDYAPTENE